MKVPLYNVSGTPIGSIELADEQILEVEQIANRGPAMLQLHPITHGFKLIGFTTCLQLMDPDRITITALQTTKSTA